MPDTPCIVAVGAHAADMEFSAGATLLKHARAGWDAHLIHLTLGEKGHATLSAADYGVQKRAEADAAAQKLQATAHYLPYHDGELAASEDIARELAGLLRELRPQVVITHWRESIHSDHTITHHLTRRALFLATIRHFDIGGLPPMRWARLYYADNWEDADNFRPYVLVDVTDVLDDWEQAFQCYAIGRGEGGFPYWDWYQARTRLHGISIRVQHAQAFAVDEARMIAPRDLL